MSEGIFVTQCEPEGFRKICYSLDRPDVLSTYTVRIHGSHAHMLSNGNPITISNNYSEWHDPFPKPSYLLLVAGDLMFDEETFTTLSGKLVKIKSFTKRSTLVSEAAHFVVLKKRWHGMKSIMGVNMI